MRRRVLLRLSLFLLFASLLGACIKGAPPKCPPYVAQPDPALPAHAQAPAAEIGMEFVYVPGGDFRMGSDPDPAYLACMKKGDYTKCRQTYYDDETPQHTVITGDYWMGKTEVTNRQYARCVADGACTPPSEDCETRGCPEAPNPKWNDPAYADHPVVGVNWYQANDFARWFGGRLPTEAEWEKACRGTDGRIYPWGNEPPDKTRANMQLDIFVVGRTPVGCFPAGASPYGALDMSGNAYEWTSSTRLPYPYFADDGRNDPARQATWQAVRGGSFLDDAINVRCATRFGHSRWASNYEYG